ncbi:MAG: starch-binding protein, partial [Oscillospiraceae bacterium]|nr:starch-binding protein [Oscillospiraceae bacterium]
MSNIIRRSLGWLLALALIAGMIYLPSPVEVPVDAATNYTTSGSTGGTTLTQYVQDGATLQCWNWSFTNIKANLGLIANLGYSSIQVSPPQEGKEGSVNKPFNNWWVLYQPISFNFNENVNNAIGTKAEFIDLCNEAHKYGIRVIVDVISNHLADNGGTTIEPSSLIPADILNDRSCWHNEYNVQSSNYADRYDITQRAMKLPDLNTGNKKIQNYVLNYLKTCIDCGADGFRYDAAKQIETPDDYYTYASDFWPTIINGANDYASSTRGIMLYHYGEMLANPDESNSLPVSAYTKYMSVTENAWSNDIRHFMHYGDVSGIQTNINKGYFKQCNADKLILWPESHDTYWDGIMNEDKSWYYGPNQAYSHEVGRDALNRTYAFLAARAYAMSLYFPRPNDMLYQEMGDIAKTGWSDESVKAVNWFKNQFAGQSEYVSTYGNFAYVERGDSGVVIVNVPGGASWASVPNHKLKAGTYKDQVTGNTFTVSADGWIYGDVGSSGVAVIYNAPTSTCSHASHGADGYCYDCYEFVGHKSGTTCSTCGTASTKTIYFKNTDSWSTPYIYGWHEAAGTTTSEWPGTAMTKVSGNIYKATVSANTANVIFNNGSGSQTKDLTPSADGDTYDNATGFWTFQDEVFYADNYYLFGNINGADYNGTEYIFKDGKLTVQFNEDSYVFVLDSNGIEYFTEGWQGEVTSVTMYPGAQVTSHNRLLVPGGKTVTLTCTPNADGSITLSYEEGGDLGGGGNSGSTTTQTIYFDATGTNWSKVNVYAWTGNTPYTGVWPGSAMTKVSGNIYSFQVPTDATGIIFNDGTSKTSDLTIPTDGKNQYTNSTGAWSVYSSSTGGNTGGSTGGSTGGNVPADPFYLFWGNGDGSVSHTEWDTPFVNGQLTITFNETMYVWAINQNGGIQYMTDGWQGNVTSVKLYAQPNLTDPNKLVVPAGTHTLTLSDNGDGSLTLSYGAGSGTGGSTGGGTTTTTDYYLVGYINGANYGCEEDYANLGQYKFVNGKLTATFDSDSYVFLKTGDNANWYLTEAYAANPPATFVSGGTEKLLVPGGVEVTFTLTENSDGSLTLNYTTGTGGDVGGDDPATGYYQLVTDMADVNAGGDFLIVAQNGSAYYMMTHTYSGTTFESSAVTVTDNKITGTNLPAFTLTAVNGGFNASVGTTSLDYTLVITKTTNGFKCTLQIMSSMGLLFKKSTSEFRFTGVSNASNSDFVQELLLFKYTEGGTSTECEHSYTSKVTTAATCTKAGVKTFTCSKCGDSYTESIPTIDHSYTSKVTAPTCTAGGYTTYTCSACGDSYTDNNTAAAGHKFSNGTCSVCGAADPDYTNPDVPAG